jgi:hypothetical protein
MGKKGFAARRQGQTGEQAFSSGCAGSRRPAVAWKCGGILRYDWANQRGDMCHQHDDSPGNGAFVARFGLELRGNRKGSWSGAPIDRQVRVESKLYRYKNLNLNIFYA